MSMETMSFKTVIDRVNNNFTNFKYIKYSSIASCCFTIFMNNVVCQKIIYFTNFICIFNCFNNKWCIFIFKIFFKIDVIFFCHSNKAIAEVFHHISFRRKQHELKRAILEQIQFFCFFLAIHSCIYTIACVNSDFVKTTNLVNHQRNERINDNCNTRL